MKIATRFVRSSALALTLVAGTLAIPHVASGQVNIRVGGPGGGGPMGGGVSRSSLDRYARILNLTPAQKDAAVALQEAYMQDQAAASREMQDAMKSVREGAQEGDMSVFAEQMPAIMKKHGEKVGALEKTFLDDVKSLLTPAQAADWPKVERLRRRESMLRFSSVSGAGVDLVTLVEGLKLGDADRAKLSATLEEYEQSMDRLLQDREADAKAERAKDGNGPRVFDPESMQAVMKREREAGMKQRELNQRYARLLASQLPDDQKAALEEQFRTKSFRNVYGDSSASRRLAAAEKLDSLTPQQRERLAKIREAYKQAARPLNDRWASAQEQAENEGRWGGGFPMMAFGGREGADQNDELSQARKARRDLDKRTADQMNEILTPEQRDQMPKPQAQFAGLGGQLEEGAVGEFIMVDEQDMGDGVAVRSVIIGATADGGGGQTVEGQIITATPVAVPPAPPPPARKD